MPGTPLQATIEDGVVFSPYPQVELHEDQSFYQYLAKQLEEFGDKPTLEADGVWLSAVEVLSLLRRYAAGLQRHGVRPGDRVCVNLSNSVQAFVSSYAVCAAGAAVVLAKPTTRAFTYLFRIVLTSTLNRPSNKFVFAFVLRVSPFFQALFSLDDMPGFQSMSSFQSLEESDFEEPAIQEPRSHTLFYTYTSGTTGLPKGVEISHYAFIAALKLNCRCEVFTAKDTVLAWNPISHVSGLLFAATALVSGAKGIVSHGGIPADQFVNTINELQITTLCAFPTAFQKLVMKLESMDVRMPSFKRLVMCGGRTTEALFERISRVFQLESMRNGYGLSEASGFTCVTPPDAIQYHSIGHPMSNMQFKVLDRTTGEKLGPGKWGELVFRGPPVMTCYHNKPQATAEVLSSDGWISSGDLGYYDESGQFFIVERLKDMIKCMDQQVAPAEVENLLMGHEAVAEAAVVGIPHQDFGEAPTAFVVLKDGRRDSVSEDTLKDIVASQSATYKHLHGGVFFVDAIPKTDTGKFLRRKLRDQHVKQQL
ncbi:unnamed protein product [Ixodes pacificus]